MKAKSAARLAVFISVILTGASARADGLASGCYGGFIRSGKTVASRSVCIYPRKEPGTFLAKNKDGFTYLLSYVPRVDGKGGNYTGPLLGDRYYRNKTKENSYPWSCGTEFHLTVTPRPGGINYDQSVWNYHCDADPGADGEEWHGFLKGLGSKRK